MNRLERSLATVSLLAFLCWTFGMMCSGNPKWIAVPSDTLQKKAVPIARP